MMRCDLYIDSFDKKIKNWLWNKRIFKIAKTVYRVLDDGRICANSRFITFHKIAKYHKMFMKAMNNDKPF